MTITEGLVYLFAAALILPVIAFIGYTIGNARLMRESAGHKFMAAGASIMAASLIIGAVFLLGIFTGTIALFTMVSVWAFGFVLVVAGGVFHIRVLRRFYRSASSVLMLNIMRLFLIGIVALAIALPSLLMDIAMTAIGEYGWGAVASLGLQVFAFTCLGFSERKYHAAFSSPPIKAQKEIKLPRGDTQALEAYLNFTNGLISRISQAIDTVSIEDILNQASEKHPILLANYKAEAGGIFNDSALAKNLNLIHETERDLELTSAFADINEGLIELFAAVISPARAADVVAAAVEAERGNIALWSAGAPLGKYNEVAYESEFLLELPEGMAEKEKARAFAYLLFKRVLEPLLRECKRSTIKKLEPILEKDVAGPMKDKVKMSEDGSLNLGLIYDHLAQAKFEVGMRETLLTFSSMLNKFSPIVKEDIGTKHAGTILSNAFTSLLQRHGQFFQQQGVMEIIPKDIDIPREFRLPSLGKSYLVEDKSPERAFKIFGDMVRRGYFGLCISTLPPAEVKKKYESMDRATVYWLSKVEIDGAVSPSNLGMLRDRILSTMSKNKKCVTLLEGLEYLATTNGFDLTLKLLHDIREAAVVHQSVLIIPIAPKAFDTRHLELLERYTEVLGEKEETT